MRRACFGLASARLRWLPAVLASVGSLASSVASAEDAHDYDWRAPPPAPEEEDRAHPWRDAGRLRGGFEFGATAGMATGRAGTSGPQGQYVLTGIGVAGELGYQFNSALSLQQRLELGVGLLTNLVGTATVVELTPVNWLSLGVGAGAEAVGGLSFGLVSPYGGVTFPVLFRFNFLPLGEWLEPGRNECWRLSFQVNPGWDPGQDLFMLRGAVLVGLTYM